MDKLTRNAYVKLPEDIFNRVKDEADKNLRTLRQEIIALICDGFENRRHRKPTDYRKYITSFEKTQGQNR